MSKTLKKLDNALGVPDSNTQVTQQSDGKLRLPQAGDRWVLISENKYYKTYLDRTKVYAEGEAQYRAVSGVFKREFTPLGSQWLGGTGDVKPDIVTVHGNLVYRGVIERKYYGNYVPDSEEEHIKDKLFHMFGWDY